VSYWLWVVFSDMLRPALEPAPSLTVSCPSPSSGRFLQLEPRSAFAVLNSIDKDEEAVTEKTFSWAQGTLSSIGLGWDTLLDATAEQYEVSTSYTPLSDAFASAHSNGCCVVEPDVQCAQRHSH
jgi:hypothetical protein